MRKPVTVLIFLGVFFILRFLTRWWFREKFNTVYTPTFESSYIILRKGNLLPLYGAIQSQRKFGRTPQIFFNNEVEIEAKALIPTHNKLLISLGVKENLLSLYKWTEICGQSIDSFIYHPLFPHLPEQKKYTPKIYFEELSSKSGFYIFGKLKNFVDGIHSFKVSSTNVAFQVWLSQDKNPQNAILVLHENMKESKELMLNKSQYIGIVLKTGSNAGKFILSWLQPGRKKYSYIPADCLEPYQKGSPHLKMDELQKVAILKAKIPLSEMYGSKKSAERVNMFKIPFVPEIDTVGLFPTCHYEPSYLLKEKLKTQYAGQWETHFTSTYPDDETDLKIYHDGSTQPQIIYGNPIIKPTIAIEVVSKVIAAIQKKHDE